MTTGTSGALDYLRRLVNDTDNERFQPDDLQRALDNSVIDVELLALHSVSSFVSGGFVEYKKFNSPHRQLKWFSDDTVVVDNEYTPLVADFVDLDNGRWEFIANQPTAVVYAIGKSYDPYGAASELMEELAGSFSDSPSSFSVLNGSFNYQESQRKGPIELSRIYANKARHHSVTIVRSDVNVF